MIAHQDIFRGVEPVVLHSRVPGDLPGHHGEFVAAKWIEKVVRDECDVWINLNWLTGVSDIDQLHHHPQIGTFAIEIKGHGLDQVKRYSPESTAFADGKEYSPGGQARLAAQQFNSWIGAIPGLEQNEQRPWIHSTVWWPQISRAAWCTKFSSPVALENSLSMLFTEDMLSVNTFEDRLRHIVRKPLRGQIAPARANHSPKFAPVRNALLEASANIQPEPAKAERLGRDVPKSRKLAQAYPHGPEYNVVFTGAPGTGKTQALLEVGRYHAQAGAKVLYVSFNKTLAADKRQEILIRGQEDFGPWNIRAVDVGQLIRMEVDPEQLGKLGDPVALLRAIPPSDRSQFDTILIDEAQDFKERDFEFTRMLLTANGSIFAVVGEGQELYGKLAPSFSRWAESATTRRLNSSYRTATEPVLVAQAVYRFLGKSIPSALNWTSARLETIRKEHSGTPTPLDLFSEVDTDIASRKIDVIRRNLESRAVSVICHEVGRISTGQEMNDDTLIVVLNKYGKYALIKEALEEFGVTHIDLVNDDNRRIAPRGHSVRLCTYHSARGLSARNVIVFEFEDLLKRYERHGTANSLANIALSRATHETRVIVPTTSVEGHVTFLETLIEFTRDGIGRARRSATRDG